MDKINTLEQNDIPILLREINDPPKKLYIKGNLPKPDAKLLCVVGARQHSSYGEEACRKLIQGLKGYNICIVSGLALGIDTIAHKTAIEVGLQTIAFPGSGLDPKVLYPYQNKRFSDDILYNGGALISEFEMDTKGALWTFPKRNRLMAGISHATLVIEAELVSGTLITSRLATEYNRDVGAVPGQIFSSLSEGPNMLIDLGAKIIRSSNDILEMLGLNVKEENKQKDLFSDLSFPERKVVELLKIEPQNNEDLMIKSGLSIRELNGVISSLEIQNLIEENNIGFKLK